MATLSLLRFFPLSKPHVHRLLFPLPPNPTLKLPSFPKSKSRISMSLSAVPAADRLISALAYTLPFINSLPYGRFLFARYPPVAQLVGPFFPLLAAFHSVPFAGFAAFFALYLGVVRNPSFGRFVRFNSMQAVVLDVLLALPSLLQRVFGTPARGWGFRVLEVGYDAIFAFAAVCFVYSVVSCILGRTPYLPIVASAADRQL